jgi:hypothetical protein
MEAFVQRAREIHGDRYDYSKVVYTNMNTKICIGCKEHGEFMQSASKHILSKRGCPTCGIKKCAKAITIPWEEFLIRARKKHGNRFQYIEETYTGMKNKMDIICPDHGKITMDAVSHCITKTGCKLCGNMSKAVNKTIAHEDFIKRANEFHNYNYDYSKALYKNGNKKITIICKNHGEFEQTAYKHLFSGCRKCADDLHASKSRKSIDKYIEDAIKIHGNLYDYSKVNYKNSKTKIIISCKIHGDFEKIASDHLVGQGCQKCKPPKHSKFAISWLKYRMVCDNVHIQHAENGGEHRIKNSLYHADGYCKETNTLYEAFGSYWHGSPKIFDPDKRNKHTGKTFGELYQNTLKKREHCLQNGYNVIEVWEWEWNKGIWAVKKLQRAFRNRSKL